MIVQLNAAPLETPKGPGLARYVIDDGPEAHLLWADAKTSCLVAARVAA